MLYYYRVKWMIIVSVPEDDTAAMRWIIRQAVVVRVDTASCSSKPGAAQMKSPVLWEPWDTCTASVCRWFRWEIGLQYPVFVYLKGRERQKGLWLWLTPLVSTHIARSGLGWNQEPGAHSRCLSFVTGTQVCKPPPAMAKPLPQSAR